MTLTKKTSSNNSFPKSNSALSNISNKKNYLDDIWYLMYRNTPKKKRTSSGVDNISLDYFNNKKEEFIKKLSQELKNKTYKPSPLKVFFKIKPNGKERVICIPTVKDRLVQRCILNYLNNLSNYAFINDVNLGFIPDGSVIKAAKKAKEFRNKHNWAYKADISSFFDNIDRDIIKDAIKKKIKITSLHELLFSIVDTEVASDNQGTKAKLNSLGIEKGRGIRQGMPLSPYLSNLILNDFDKSALDNKLNIVRYADDFIVLADSEEKCLEAHKFCKTQLKKIKLDLHDITEDGKTVIRRPDQAVEFLGVNLEKQGKEYQLVISNKQIEKIRSKLFLLSDLDYLLKHKITLSRLTAKLDNSLDGYQHSYDDECTNKTSLLDKLQDWRPVILKRAFESNLPIKLNDLTKKQKIFFEIDKYLE